MQLQASARLMDEVYFHSHREIQRKVACRLLYLLHATRPLSKEPAGYLYMHHKLKELIFVIQIHFGPDIRGTQVSN